MDLHFSKIYAAGLILAIPFYYFWGWIRYTFTGDSSMGIGYAIESFSLILIFFVISSVVISVRNKFKNLWDYIIFTLSIIPSITFEVYDFIYWSLLK